MTRTRRSSIGDRLLPAPRGGADELRAASARPARSTARSSRSNHDADRSGPRLGRHARQGRGRRHRRRHGARDLPGGSADRRPAAVEATRPHRRCPSRRCSIQPERWFNVPDERIGLAVRVPRLRSRFLRARAQHDGPGRTPAITSAIRSTLRGPAARGAARGALPMNVDARARRVGAAPAVAASPRARWSICCARSAIRKRVVAATPAQRRRHVPARPRRALDAAPDADAPRRDARLARASRATTSSRWDDADYPRLRSSRSAIRRRCSIAWDGASSSARPAFAIVGSRNATPQGCADAAALRRRRCRAAGLTIVSGLALGIDAAAHRGGLAGAGSSIAVIGTGPDRVYPARNRDARARARGARAARLRVRARARRR